VRGVNELWRIYEGHYCTTGPRISRQYAGVNEKEYSRFAIEGEEDSGTTDPRK